MARILDELKALFVPRRSRRLVAIDFDSRCVRLAAAQRVGGRPQIEELLSIDVPEGLNVEDAGAFGEFLGRILRGRSLRWAGVVMSVPRGKAVLKPLTLPAGTTDAEAAGMVQYQVGKELPFRPEEAVVDFTFGSHYDVEAAEQPPASGRDVLVAAAAIPVIDYFRQLALAAKIRLERLDLRSSANVRCIRLCGPAEGDRPVAVVHIDADETEIDVLAGGSLAFSRSAVVRVPLADAADAPELRAVVLEVAREAIRSLQSYQAVGGGEPVEKVIVAGGTGIEAEAARQIARSLGVHCELFSSAGAVDLPPGAAEPLAFLAVIGMTLGAAEPRRGFNFLDPKRPPVQRNVRKIRAAAIGAAAAAVLLAVIVGGAAHLYGRRSRVSDLEAQLKAIQPDLKRVKALKDRVERLEGWASLGQGWLDYINDATRAYPLCREAYATGITADIGGRKGQIQTLVLDSPTIDKIRMNRLRDRMRAVGFPLGRPGGAPAAGQRSDEFKEAVRLELLITPGLKTDPSAVTEEPRPKDDRWGKTSEQIASVQQASAPPSPPGGGQPSGGGEAPPAPGAQPAQAPEGAYQQIEWSMFDPDSPAVRTFMERPVQFRGIVQSSRGDYVLPQAPKEAYNVVELRQPGDAEPHYAVLSYWGKQSKALDQYREILQDRRKSYYARQNGMVIQARAWYLPEPWRARSDRHRACPIAVIVDAVYADVPSGR